MNETKLATQTLRMDYWADLIRDRSQSGLTIQQYCSEHGLSCNAYYYWLRKIKAATLESAGISFVELATSDSKPEPASSASFHTEAVMTVGAATIAINSGTSTELLTRILEGAKDAQ